MEGLRFHSYVGLVTNSSSETYTTLTAGSRDRMIRMIDAILAAGGSDKRAEDLFEFRYVMHYLLANTSEIDLDGVNEKYGFDPPVTDQEEARQALFVWSIANDCCDVEVYGDDFESYKAAVDLVIVPREGVDIPEEMHDLCGFMQNCFDASEYDWN